MIGQVYFITRNREIVEDVVTSIVKRGTYKGCYRLNHGRWAFPIWNLVFPRTEKGKRQAEERLRELTQKQENQEEK